jgi:hypothetical protein
MPPGVVVQPFGDDLVVADNEGWKMSLDPGQSSSTHMSANSPLAIVALLLAERGRAVMTVDTDKGTEKVDETHAIGVIVATMPEQLREYAAGHGIGTLAHVVLEEGGYQAIII